MTNNKATIEIKQEIPLERVYSLLVSALEGGSNYWYMVQKEILPPMPYTFTDNIWMKEREKDARYINTCEIALNEGGALMIDDERADEPEIKSPVRLDLDAIKKGLQAWATDAMKPDDDKTRTAHPHHWGDFLSENDDAETADCFLQYCIFGKVIYG